MNTKMLKLGKKPSVMRTLFEYGKKLKEEYGSENVFDFSLGNPDIEPPIEVQEALAKLIKQEHVHAYTSNIGDVNARESVARYLRNNYHADIDAKYVFLTCGASACLTTVIHALVEKDDEVIIFAPYFPEYCVYIEGALAHYQVVKPNDNFEPDLDDFINKINEKTRAVIINTPNNPSGKIYCQDSLKRLGAILNEKQKEYGHHIYLVSDEPYRELIYDNEDFPLPANYYDNTIICYSYSKSLSLAGERIGYIAINNKVIEKDDLLLAFLGANRSLGFVCAPSIFQHLIPEIENVKVDLSRYHKRREYLFNALKEIGYEMVKPQGAFYLFVKALEDDAYAFMEKAKKYHLLLSPSDSFGVKGYVRLSYCLKFDNIQKSIPAFKALYEEYFK